MKGYIFTLAAFILLLITFYLVIVRSENVSLIEDVFSTLTKTHTLQEYTYLLNEHNTKSLINISAKYALIMLAFHTGEYPIKGTPQDTNFSKVLLDLINTGKANGDYFVNNRSLELPEKSLTINGVVNQINNISKKSGFIYNATLTSLNAKLIDTNLLRIDYTLQVNIQDIQNKTGKIANFTSYVIIDLEGLPDPIGERLLSSQSTLPPYYSAITFGPKPKLNISYGQQGNKWLYGRIDIPSEDEPNIVMGSFEEVKNLRDSNTIDGIIIQEDYLKTEVACPHVDPLGNTYKNETNTFNDVRWKETKVCDKVDPFTQECVQYRWECNRAPPLYPYDKPWILIKNPMIGKNELGQRTVLIITNSNYGKTNMAFTADVEEWRDAINCGRAFKTSVAPDYIQRFYEKATSLQSLYGYAIIFIEDEYANTGGLSSVGFERLKGKSGRPIRGLAGCKGENFEKANCTLPTTTRISEDLLNNTNSPFYELQVLAK